MNTEIESITGMGEAELIDMLKEKFPEASENTETAFCKAVYRMVPKSLEEGEKENCRILIGSMETILEEQARYSRLSVDIIVQLAKITGHTPRKIISSISRNSNKLKLPTVSWANKNMRVADVLAEHPKLGDISNVEKIDSIRRLDDDRIKEAAESGSIVDPSGQTIDIQQAPMAEVRKAVNQIIKHEKESELEDDELADSQDFEDQAIVTQTVEAAPRNRAPQMLEDILELHENALEELPKMIPDSEVIIDILERVKVEIESLRRHVAQHSELSDFRADSTGGGSKSEVSDLPN